MSATRKVSIAVVIFAAFIMGVLFTTVGANVFDLGDRIAIESVAGPGDTAIEEATAGSVLALEDAFTRVAEVVSPTVVQIRSERITERTNPFSRFEGTPFDNFFPAPDRNENNEYRSQGLGSGVIARSDGYIITNNHVIEGADELEVVLFSGQAYDAEIVGTDPGSDLAVIKIAATDLPAVSFGDMAHVRVGQWVMAFGSPLSSDLDNTVTAGIVSALSRTSSGLNNLNTFSAFIQTDAAINPGNSGGPLMNLQGQLIGINSAIFSRSGGNQGIGFAIPVSVVENVAFQLIEKGSVERGFLGVNFGQVPNSLALALGVPRGSAQVTAVVEGTAAEEAGLREGDVITAVDGIQLRDFNQLRTIIGNKRPGDTVDLALVRDKEQQNLIVTLGTRPPDEQIAGNEVRPRLRGDSQSGSAEMKELGMNLRDLSPRLLEELGEADVEGVYLAQIDRGSDAYRESELRQGDIITEIDKRPVRNVSEFMDIYESIDAGETFLVRILRVQGGLATPFFTALTKPE